MRSSPALAKRLERCVLTRLGVGLSLIVWGFGLARADSPVALWPTPIWTRHLAAMLTLPAFILLVAAYVAGQPHQGRRSAIRWWRASSSGRWPICWPTATLADLLLFGAFLAWAVARFHSARRRDRAAGRTYPVRGWPRDAAVVAIGFAAWAGFAFWGHAWLIGVAPFRVARPRSSSPVAKKLPPAM
jgi:uncharacterized membrane protein